MPKRLSQGDEQMVRLALSIIDLRAHFEAQLRSVTRAEESLRRCQSARGTVACQASVDGLQGEIGLLSDNNRSARTVLDQAEVDVRALRSAIQSRGVDGT